VSYKGKGGDWFFPELLVGSISRSVLSFSLSLRLLLIKFSDAFGVCFLGLFPDFLYFPIFHIPTTLLCVEFSPPTPVLSSFLRVT
jgi:hypothetical protein